MRTLTCILGALRTARDNSESSKVKLSPHRTSTCPSWSRDSHSNKCRRCPSASTSCWLSGWTTISSDRLSRRTSTQSPSRRRRVITKRLMKLLSLSSMKNKTERIRDPCLHTLTIPLPTLSKSIIHTLQWLRSSSRKAHLKGLQSITQGATLKRLQPMRPQNLLTASFKAAEKASCLHRRAIAAEDRAMISRSLPSTRNHSCLLQMNWCRDRLLPSTCKTHLTLDSLRTTDSRLLIVSRSLRVSALCLKLPMARCLWEQLPTIWRAVPHSGWVREHLTLNSTNS